jgi:hypothetical protein
MEKIIRIHEKILDHLIGLLKKDSKLIFVPRKINNKQRLDNGYWFIGDDNYLNLSFWNGTDWKEKIHNIGFVVLHSGESHIELSAQDSPSKSIFLEKIAKKIGGFIKDGSKNKWYKHYSGTDFIKNIDSFITSVKPIIDNIIIRENPEDIYLLDQEFFDKYTQNVIRLRQEQIEFGKRNKLSRICWNTKNWNFPSGSQGKSISTEAYEADTGFGHEEWLFDKTKIVDDYHYAFLQPLFLKTDKHVNEIYDISLFTINNLNKQYYVGEIKNVECITREESERVYRIYQSKKWIAQMQSDVERVGGNYEKFYQSEPSTFFNVRFKFKDVSQPDELIEIANSDINITTNRYKLLPRKTDITFGMTDEDNETEGNIKNTNKRRKVFNSDCEYDPYHDQMQNAIFEFLKTSKKDNYKKVFIEKDRVDIKAKTQMDTWHYFEIKTDNPKKSIRQALGQIIEYAYFPNTEKAEKLIIVADTEPNNDVIKYLDHIRNKFDLPITYRYFDFNKNELSNDY